MAFTLAYAECRGNSHNSSAGYGRLAPQHGRGGVLLTINVLQVPMMARAICPSSFLEVTSFFAPSLKSQCA